MRNIVRARLVTAASLTALALAGCREDEARALRYASEPSPIGYGYAGMTLPMAEPARVSWYEPERGYEWAERAYGLQQAYYDAPPDYTFDYGPYDPWVWESADDGYMYAEPWGDEGYLYYYYEPEAAYPYFVRDSDYGYGFDPNGVLVALFDPYGNYLPLDRYQAVAPLAGRYFAHGRELRRASQGTARIKVDHAAWEQRAPLIRSAGDTWIRAAQSDGGWKAWRAKDERRQVASLGAPERREKPASFRSDDRKPERVRAEKHERPPGHARQEDRGRARDLRDEPRHARAAEDRGRPASFEDRGGRSRGGDDRGQGRSKAEHGGGDRGRGSDPGGQTKPERHGGGHERGQDHGGGHGDAGHGGGHGGGGQKDGGKGGGKKD